MTGTGVDGYPLMTPRAAFALVLAALASTLGALVLGEYQFNGVTPYFGAALFGLVIGELVADVGRLRSPLVGSVAALQVAGALLWAAWISTSEGLRPLPGAVWPAMAIGAVCAGWRTGRWGRPSGSGPSA